MKSLKTKWAEALPVFASTFFLIGIIFLLIWGLFTFGKWISSPDPRTVEEIKIDKYKDCIKYVDRNSRDKIKNCEVYLEIKSI
jgi:hypothetical protein